MPADVIKGKRILVVGGAAREPIDGIRHYANHGRPELHGLHAARILAQHGAQVTLVSTMLHGRRSKHLRTVEEINGQSILHTHQLVEALHAELQQPYDAVLQLANIPAVQARAIAPQKLKLKNEADAISLEVTGNVDIQAALLGAGGNATLAGYNTWQEWFTSGDDALAAALKAVAQQTLTPPEHAHAKQDITLSDTTLAGHTVIVTSGPTAEPISTHGDVISNFSSGRQGAAVARALADHGAQVIFISGPAPFPLPHHPGIRIIACESADAMCRHVLAHLPADVYIGVAAVADFGMKQPASLRVPPGEAAALSLTQTTDILQAVGTHQSKRPKLVIGFAAETQDVVAYARRKLEKKKADAICANRVGAELLKGSPDNQITWVDAKGAEKWEYMDKNKAGQHIAAKITELLKENHSPLKAGIG